MAQESRDADSRDEARRFTRRLLQGWELRGAALGLSRQWPGTTDTPAKATYAWVSGPVARECYGSPQEVLVLVQGCGLAEQGVVEIENPLCGVPLRVQITRTNAACFEFREG